MDNFFTPGQQFRPEVDRTAELQQLQRRQQLAEALQARAMQVPIQANSDKSAAFQALALMGQQLLAGRSQREAAQKQQQIRAETDAVQQANLEAYLGQREGPAAKEALLRAMLSRDPRLQELAKMDAAAAQQRAGFKDQVIDKALVRVPNSGGPVQKLYEAPREQWKDETIQGPTGPILVARNTLTNEPKAIDRTPKVSVSNNMGNEGATAAEKELGKKVPEVLQKAQESFIQSQQALEGSQRLMELAKSPDLVTGFGAGVVTGLNALGAKLGFTGPDAAAQTQAAMAEMANNTLNQVKRLTGAITEKERPFLEMAASGKLDWEPETLRHLAGIAQAAAHNDIIQSYKQYQGAAGVPGASQGAAMYPLPPLEHSLDPSMFEERRNGFVRYKGVLPGLSKGAKEPAAPASQLKVYNW